MDLCKTSKKCYKYKGSQPIINLGFLQHPPTQTSVHLQYVISQMVNYASKNNNTLSLFLTPLCLSLSSFSSVSHQAKTQWDAVLSINYSVVVQNWVYSFKNQNTFFIYTLNFMEISPCWPLSLWGPKVENLWSNTNDIRTVQECFNLKLDLHGCPLSVSEGETMVS